MTRTTSAMQRNVETLAHSLATATRRAAATMIDEDGATVPRHPGAAVEVERLQGLHDAALAELEARLEDDDYEDPEGEAHERALTDGIGSGASADAE